jgi:ribosomal protein L12E/L44/L45/RPP1/RPP2
MKQLSGVDLDSLLHNIARLPGAAADAMEKGPTKGAGSDGDEVFGKG